MVHVWLVLGWVGANRARSVQINFDDERVVVCVGDGWWFLYELEPDIDPEQHTATGDGSSDGGAFIVDVRTRTDRGVVRGRNCASS